MDGADFVQTNLVSDIPAWITILMSSLKQSSFTAARILPLAVTGFLFAAATIRALPCPGQALAAELASHDDVPKDRAHEAARKLFNKHCAKCHGADGKGSAARSMFPKIPDFSQTKWHKQRKDSELAVSIRDGKGDSMPSWKAKFSEAQVGELVSFVRTFDEKASKEKTGPESAIRAAFAE